MKYIIVRRGALELPVLFDECIQHAAIAVGPDHNGNPATPIAAGFVDTNGQCSGRSIGLNLESRGVVDAKLIRRMMED